MQVMINKWPYPMTARQWWW